MSDLYTVCYKLQVIACAEEHGNRMEERHSGPPPTEKMIRVLCAQKDA